MADTNYWDYYGTAATSWRRVTATDSSASFTYFSSGTTWASSGIYSPCRVVNRKILVTAPDNWSDGQNMGFVELVNIKTKTRWKVTLVIKGGDILITDPDVEKRTMEDFIPLLKNSADIVDIEIINEFFNSNPIQ
jgi:hypothetical protein